VVTRCNPAAIAGRARSIGRPFAVVNGKVTNRQKEFWINGDWRKELAEKKAAAPIGFGARRKFKVNTQLETRVSRYIDD